MRIAIALSAVVLVIARTLIHADDENEKKISISDCPKAVQKTLKNEAKNGKIIDVDVRKIDGMKIYESEVWFGDAEYDLVIRGDGRLLSKHFEGQANQDDEDEDDEDDDGEADDDGDDDEDEDGDDDDGDDDDDEMETRVSLKDLPKAVRKTLKREARGGEIEEIMKETEDGEVVYEAEVEYGEKEYEVEIAADGTLLSKVLEEDEDDDEGDDDRDDDDDDDDDD